jgi:HPt (histidine-containing phosphotransfer) domain-containing protein
MTYAVSPIRVRQPGCHNRNMSVAQPSYCLNLDQLRDVTLGDPELMRDIVSALVEDTEKHVALLARAAAAADARECVRLAHYAKGACANLGAESLANLLRGIEQTAGRGDFDLCEPAVQAITGELQHLREFAATL